jgi:LAGLIDADG DNA endonuclease family
MDDGQQVKKGGVTLCTDSYNSEEVNFLREAIKANFNVETTIHKKKSRIIDTVYERIYINKNSLEDIKPSLMEHLHSSMLYKINEEVQIKQDYSDIESDIELIDIFGEF